MSNIHTNMAGIRTETVRLYLFELAERASRFYIHLDDIKKQFYSFNRKVDDKLIFIQSYKECILRIVSATITLIKELDQEQNQSDEQLKKYLESAKILLTNINTLHKDYLGFLPRPSEPIELRRFSRIIDKHVVKLGEEGGVGDLITDKKQISIYVSEEIGDSVYSKDPLSKFKENRFSQSAETINSIFSKEIVQPLSEQPTTNNTIHITIPRIDANNPCRWPTLIHELGHNILNKDFFKNGNIESDFKASLIDKQIEFVTEFEAKNKVIINAWLNECWCDLFACVVFGPAFWFSQYVSFIFETGPNDDVNYPTPLFRLKLIYNILLHRFSSTLFTELKQAIELCDSLVEYFDRDQPLSFNENDDCREIYMYFKEYFRKYFFKGQDSTLQFETDILNSKLSPLIKYTEEIDESTIRHLQDNLKEGFPVPSKIIDVNYLAEKPTYVQEILLAAWCLRNNWFQDLILKELLSMDLDTDIIVIEYESKVLKAFKKFDESILRSIQVSEWFDLFYDVEMVKQSIKIEDDLQAVKLSEENRHFQLVDVEIYNHLKDKSLRIIPTMSLKEQLGATSFDLRLGTSFQIYYQNKYGTIDFSDPNSLREAELNSNLIDLDFAESITISPGQFLLAHTMEYLKLPENITAEIEGRSSFARLGLEIHMTAGFVDPGFEGVVTLELYNAGPNPIKLFPGIRIAQLKFLPINYPLRPYNKRNDAKYKGLLSHHTSMQFKDYEIEKIRKNTQK